MSQTILTDKEWEVIKRILLSHRDGAYDSLVLRSFIKDSSN